MRDGASRAGRMKGRNVRNAGRSACIFAGKVRNVGHMTGRKVRNVGHNACLFVGRVRKLGHTKEVRYRMCGWVLWWHVLVALHVVRVFRSAYWFLMQYIIMLYVEGNAGDAERDVAGGDVMLKQVKGHLWYVM